MYVLEYMTFLLLSIYFILQLHSLTMTRMAEFDKKMLFLNKQVDSERQENNFEGTLIMHIV